jgi:hypothetical protein
MLVLDITGIAARVLADAELIVTAFMGPATPAGANGTVIHGEA